MLPYPSGKYLSVTRPVFVAEKSIAELHVFHFTLSKDCAFSVNLLWYDIPFSSLKLVFVRETETVIEQTLLFESLMTKDILALSALTALEVAFFANRLRHCL